MGEKVQVCVPVCGPMYSVPVPFVTCIPTITGAVHSAPGVDGHWWVFDSHFPVDANRNHLVKQAIERGADWTLWLDCDMSFPEEMVPTLFQMARQFDCSIVSGIYFKKRPPFVAVAMVAAKDRPRGYYYSIDPIAHPDSAVSVDLVGMGCALIHTRVFKALTLNNVPAFGPPVGRMFGGDRLPPWFRYSKRHKSGWREVSEEVAFFQDARAAGFEILVHTSLECKHYTSNGIGLEHFADFRDRVDEFPEE